MLEVIENCVYPKRLEFAYDYALMDKHVAAEIVADDCLLNGVSSEAHLAHYVAMTADYLAVRLAYLGY